MKRLKHSRFFMLLLGSLLIGACTKSVDKPDKNPSDPELNLSPKFSSTINGELFEATTIFARYQSDGRFAISATDSTGSSFYFSIRFFAGNGAYSFGLNSPDEQPVVKYTQVLGSDTLIYRNIPFGTVEEAGTIEVNSYTENPPVVGGKFDFSLINLNNPDDTLQIENGEFSDSAILPKLTSFDPGTITMWFKGKKYHSSVTEAKMFEGLFIELAFLSEETQNERFRYEIPLSPSGQIPTFSYNWHGSLPNQVSTDYFQQCTENYVREDFYDIVDNKLTGYFSTTQFDLELYFNAIPVNQNPFSDQSGQVSVNTSGGLFVFTEIETYEFVFSNVLPYTFLIEGYNDQGQHLKVQGFENIPFSSEHCNQGFPSTVRITAADGSVITDYLMRCTNIRGENTGLARIAGDAYDYYSLTDFSPAIYGKDIPFTIVE